MERSYALRSDLTLRYRHEGVLVDPSRDSGSTWSPTLLSENLDIHDHE